MAQERITSKIFVGVVVTVLSAIIVAAIGLGGGGSTGGGTSSGGGDGFSRSTTPNTPTLTNICYTDVGTCFINPLPEGSACECFDGFEWWPGIT